MKKQGKELEFISSINRDGSGTEPITEEVSGFVRNEWFHVHRLSITYNTYIACGFNSYVVRLKVLPSASSSPDESHA